MKTALRAKQSNISLSSDGGRLVIIAVIAIGFILWLMVSSTQRFRNNQPVSETTRVGNGMQSRNATLNDAAARVR